MWHKISRSASCRIERNCPPATTNCSATLHSSQHSLHLKPHTTRHAQQTQFLSSHLPNSTDDIKLISQLPPAASIYCVVNKPVTSVIGRSSYQSSRSTTVDENITIPEETATSSTEEPEDSLEKISDRIVSRRRPHELTQSLDILGYNPVTISYITSAASSLRTGHNPLGICSAATLPQYKTIPFTAAATHETPIWQSAQWLDLLDRAARTAVDDTTFKHVQVSETRALINKLRSAKPRVSLTVREEQDIQITSDTESDCAHNRLWNKRIDGTHPVDVQTELNTACSSLDICNCTFLPTHHINRCEVEEPCVWQFPQDLHEQVKLALANSSSDRRSHRNELDSSSSNGLGLCAATRLSVVAWMGKVIESMDWPLSAYFTAVHAMDYTLRQELVASSTRQSPEYGIPLLSTACVLIGVSAECEHKQLSRAKYFVGQVPNVTNVRDIICKELSVVAGLKDGSLLHKTAPDFCLYYAARMKAFDKYISEAEGTFDSLFNELCYSNFNVKEDKLAMASNLSSETSSLLSYLMLPRRHNSSKKRELPPPDSVLGTILEISLAVSQSLVGNSLHTMIPMSRVVAAIMFHIVTLIAPGMSCAAACSEFCRRVFLLDYDTEVKVFFPILFLLYESCIRTIQTDVSHMGGGHSSANGFNKCSQTALLVMKRLLLGKYTHGLPGLTTTL